MARKIAYLTDFLSDGMGYTENCLPPTLQKLGYEVQVFCSGLQVYGTSTGYDANYGAFLGPRAIPAGSYVYRGVQVNRLAHKRVGRYVDLPGLVAALHRFGPDIVQVNAPVSPVAIRVALAHASWKLYTECHQHLCCCSLGRVVIHSRPAVSTIGVQTHKDTSRSLGSSQNRSLLRYSPRLCYCSNESLWSAGGENRSDAGWY